MGKMHFFTNPDLLNIQSSIQAFGAKSSETNGGVQYDVFNTSSIHSATVDAEAIAPMNGIVCFQEDINDNNLINVIICPSENTHLVNKIIKFIIYKGILKSSIVQSSGILMPIGTNTFIDRIWDAQNNFNEKLDIALGQSVGTTTTEPNSDSLGLSLKKYTSTPLPIEHIEDTEYIDILFSNNAKNVSLPIVVSGDIIGKFQKDTFSVSIVKISNSVTCSYVRKSDSKILIPSIIGVSTNAEIFEHWHNKRECLSFFDYCCFLSISSESSVFSNDSNGISDKHEGNNVYQNLLKGSSNFFFNRNKLFIEIYNEYDEHLSYYDNYTSEIKLDLDNSGTYSIIDFYRSGWPILEIDNTEFPPAISNNEIQFNLKINSINSERARILSYEKFSVDTISRYTNTYIEISVESGFTVPVTLICKNNSGGNTEIISDYYQYKVVSVLGNIGGSQGIKAPISGVKSNINIYFNEIVQIPFVVGKTELRTIKTKIVPFYSKDWLLNNYIYSDGNHMLFISTDEDLSTRRIDSNASFANNLIAIEDPFVFSQFVRKFNLEEDGSFYGVSNKKNIISTLFSKTEFDEITNIIISTFDIRFPVYLFFEPYSNSSTEDFKIIQHICDIKVQGLILNSSINDYENKVETLSFTKAIYSSNKKITYA